MIVIAILVSAFLLRIININQSLWLDEATQVILSSKSLQEIIFNRTADFHPPLSYIIYHFWIQVLVSETWLRLLPVIFGVLTVFLTFKLASLFFNKWIATTSALMMAIAPYHIYYSQEVRMYSMSTFFAATSMYLFILQIKGNFKLTTILAFILVNAALIYTHYLTFFLIISQLLFLILFTKGINLRFIKQYLIVGILYLPWVPQFLKQLEGGMNVDTYLPHWREVLTLDIYKAVPLTLFKFSMGRIDFENQTLYIIVAGIVITVFGYLIIKGILTLKKSEWILAVSLITPILLALAASLRTPLFQPFRLLFVLPFFYILLACGIYGIGKLKYIFLALVLLISMIGNCLYFFDPKFQREDWKGAIRFLEKQSDSKEVKVLSVWPEPFPPYQWYRVHTQALALGPGLPYDYHQVDQVLGSWENKEIYLFEYLQDLSDPDRQTQKWLEVNKYEVSEVVDFRGVGFIYHYVKK